MNRSLLAILATVISAPAFAQSTSTSATTPATTVSVPTAEVKSDVASKLSFTLAAETWVAAKDANRGDFEGSIEEERQGINSYQYIGAGYDLGNSKSVQLRQYTTFQAASKTYNNENEYRGGDTVIRYQDKKSFTLGALPVASQARIYMPLLSDARDTSIKVGEDNPLWTARFYNSVSQSYGKLDLGFTLQNRFYNREETNKGKETWRLYPIFEIGYNINPTVKPFANIYSVHQFYKTGGDTANADTFATDLGLEFNIGKNVNLLGYVTTEDNLRTGADSYDPTNEDQNTYEIDLYITL